MSSSCPAVPRLPSPPISGSGAVVALAAGALVAAAQSTYDELVTELPASAVRSVASISVSPTPVVAPVADPAPGLPAEADDLAALAKGARIGREVARDARMLADARADGAPAAALSGAGVAVQPVEGRITSTPGARWGTTHYGLDIANRIGTPIFAVAEGTVEKAGSASGFGLWVVIRHADGSRSVYGHINQALVSAGEKVSAGDRIAEVGNRGQSTGPHLHLEIRAGSATGDKLDPVAWLRERGVELGS